MLPFWCFSGFSSHFPVHWKVRIPDSSVGKESACNAGDPSSIPGSGRSSGEGISYPLLYSWASLVAQLLKNPPAMRETWDQSLGWENPLKKGTTTHSRILAWRIPWTIVHGVTKSWTFNFTLINSLHNSTLYPEAHLLGAFSARNDLSSPLNDLDRTNKDI